MHWRIWKIKIAWQPEPQLEYKFCWRHRVPANTNTYNQTRRAATLNIYLIEESSPIGAIVNSWQCISRNELENNTPSIANATVAAANIIAAPQCNYHFIR